MNVEALIPVFFKTLVYNLPAMVVMVAGVIWVNMSWERHPPAARWAMLAFVWMLVTYILAICWHSFGILFLLRNNLPLDEQTPYLMTLSCLEALSYIFFMLAVNAARYPYRPPQYYDHFADDEPPPPTQ